MRTRIFILSALLLFLLAACGGGPSLTPTPSHLLTGTDQLRKGTAFYHRGCFQLAFDHFFRAHELYAASDQLSGVAMSLNNIGTVYRATGDFEGASAFFDKAFEIYQDLGDESGQRQALSNKAAVLIELGRLDQAQKVIEAAERISGDETRQPFVPLLGNRGVLLTRKKEYAAAEKVLKEALAAVDPENSAEKATVNFALGQLMIERKRWKDAIGFFQTALGADRQQGFYKGMADDLSGMGRAFLAAGDRAGAVKCWERSVKIYALIKLPEEVRKTMAHIRMAAPGTGVDIRVTELFVQRWLEGKVYEQPCED